MLAAGLSTAALALASPALPHASAAPSQTGDAPLNAQDRTYLHDSPQGDLFEIRGGHVALRKGGRWAVRHFGRVMVRDHSMEYNDAKALGTTLGVDIPTRPSAGQHDVLRLWRSMNRHSFACAYISYEWEDHQLDIADAKDEIKDGQNQQVIKAAEDSLPVLNKHLALAERALHHLRGC